MEWTWKKTFLVLAIFVAIFVVPVWLCTSGMMDYYHEKIDADPKADSSKWLALKTADICSSTGRPARAADYYKKFLKLYPEDERRPQIRVHCAEALEDSLKYAEAADMFKEIELDYPENLVLVKRAKEGWARCKYGIGNR